MFSLTTTPNADAVVTKLLSSLSITGIDQNDVSNQLEKHPDYPSLLAISDVLTSFHIENSAYRVDNSSVLGLQTPFIAHTDLNTGDFVVVTKIAEDKVFVSNNTWRRHKFNADAFLKIYSGTVLTAEPPQAVKTAVPLKIILSNLKAPFVVTCLVLMLLSALIFKTGYFAALSWQSVWLTLAKGAGLLTAVLLLIQSIDSNNPLVQVLCQAGGKTNCNAILSSKAAKIVEGFSWSEAGFFYFAGTWLFLLFGGNTVFTWRGLAVLNFVSLPYTFYSIYYQARVARQWCVLCCTVQALLWLEFIPLLSGLTGSHFLNNTGVFGGNNEAEVFTTLFICLLGPVIFWLLAKPLLLKAQQLQPLKQQLRMLKYNSELFYKMLSDQPKYTQPAEEWCIVLGSPTASNVITMISNPYCPPCSKTHQLLDELLEERSDIQARILFTANNTDNDIKTPISRHLVALNELPDKEKIKQALNDWYNQKQKNYEAWSKLYPVELNGVEYHKIDKQKAWCDLAEVAVTPTLLLNGYRLPDLYRLSDLKYMLQ